MLTNADFGDICSEIGIASPTDEIPTMLLAEYFRAATTSLYTNEPISTQRLMAAVEPRLRPLGYSRSRFADECFGNANDATSRPLSVLNTLDEIGDFVRVEGGGHYPAEARFVRVVDSLCLVASALPTVTLESRARFNTAFPALGRLVDSPPHEMPEQSIESWLGTPTLNFAAYASERIRSKGESMRTTADGWQVYDASIKSKCWINAYDRATDGTHLCRFQPEGITTFQYGVGHLVTDEHNVICTRFTQLTFAEAGRVRYGLHVISGVSRVWLGYVGDHWFEISVSTYEGTELLRLLQAMSVESQWGADKRTRFWISTRLQPSLTKFLSQFGINLVIGR